MRNSLPDPAPTVPLPVVDAPIVTVAVLLATMPPLAPLKKMLLEPVVRV